MTTGLNNCEGLPQINQGTSFIDQKKSIEGLTRTIPESTISQGEGNMPGTGRHKLRKIAWFRCGVNP